MFSHFWIVIDFPICIFQSFDIFVRDNRVTTLQVKIVAIKVQSGEYFLPLRIIRG